MGAVQGRLLRAERNRQEHALPSWRAQPHLLNEPRLPAGLRYMPDLISPAEKGADCWNKPHEGAFRLTTLKTARNGGPKKETAMAQQIAGYPPQDYGQPATKDAEDRLRDTAEATGERIKAASDSAQDVAPSVADKARRYGKQAQDAVKQFRPFVEKSLKQQPMATLAGAAAIGFVLGALWKK